MKSLRVRSVRVGLFACLLLVVGAPVAAAREPSGGVFDNPVADASLDAVPLSSSHHGPTVGHLPPLQQEMELVGQLSPTGEFGDVLPGQIADLAVHKGYAYLNSWDNADCERGGTYVVDIRDPANPSEVAFIPAEQPYYHGEGAHVVTLNTPQFQGDLLAVNDETYGSNLTATCAPADKTHGGFDLYDVSDPANPVTLVQGFGDQSPDDGTVTPVPAEGAGNSYHSVFVWQSGPRAFLVGVDNVELHDVDIYDITDPANPEFIAEYDLVEEFPEIVDDSALGNGIFLHDMVVKRIGGRQIMSASYWDAGYVQLDVTDPLNPTLVSDTNFDDPDPLTGLDPPQGNAHQSEFSHDNQFLLAADEEFAPFRLVSEITEAPFEGYDFTAALGGAEPLPEGGLAGDTVFVGSACTGTVAAPPAGVTIAVAERGVCAGGFQEKVAAIQAAGYEAAIIMNNSWGAGGNRCETLINMLLDPDTINIPSMFVGRAEGLRILGVYDEATYQCTGAETETPSDTDVPAVGSGGLAVEVGPVHDGWGYAHLYDAVTGEELDAFAIPESLDERYADGFGDLSIHEFATDPTENLAYSSYYSGGMRVLRFSRQEGLRQTGAYIDPDGSNFWGVEQFTTPQGERLIAGSDRDFGIQILRYTGPGAPARPQCENKAVVTEHETPVLLPLTCTDANGNPLTRRITSAPAHGTLGPISGDSVLYTPAQGYSGPDTVGFAASDGAAESAPAQVSVTVAGKGARPSNRIRIRIGRFRNGKLPVFVRVKAPGVLKMGLRRLATPGRASSAHVVLVARTRVRLGSPGRHRVVLKLRPVARRQLARALSTQGRARMRLRVNWKPTGGVTRRTARTFTIKG